MKDGIVLNATVNHVNDGALSITSLKYQPSLCPHPPKGRGRRKRVSSLRSPLLRVWAWRWLTLQTTYSNIIISQLTFIAFLYRVKFVFHHLSLFITQTGFTAVVMNIQNASSI